MTPLAQLGYEVMQRAIQAGVGPDKAWDQVAQAMARYVRDHDRAELARRERATLRGDWIDQEIRRRALEAK